MSQSFRFFSLYCVLLFHYSVQSVTLNFLFVVVILWLFLLSISGLILTKPLFFRETAYTTRTEEVGKYVTFEEILNITYKSESKIILTFYLSSQIYYVIIYKPKVKFFDRPMLCRKLQFALKHGLLSIKLFDLCFLHKLKSRYLSASTKIDLVLVHTVTKIL